MELANIGKRLLVIVIPYFRKQYVEATNPIVTQRSKPTTTFKKFYKKSKQILFSMFSKLFSVGDRSMEFGQVIDI